jgi:pimeloyl-ACP methyl ester carboxylesterase
MANKLAQKKRTSAPRPEPPAQQAPPRHHAPARHEAHPALQIHDIGRRRFLLTMGTAAAVTAFRTNIAVDYQFTENTSFKVITPKNDANAAAAAAFPGAAWYLLGGFKVSNRTAGNKLAALQPAMNERAQASFIGYSNEGIDVAQLFIAIQNDVFQRKIHTVYLYGDSFGGMVAVVLAPLLEQNGIHVKMIVFGSSPSSVADVLDPAKGYISLAGAVVPYLGIVGRLALGAWNGLANPNGQDMYEAARGGIELSFDGGRTSLILNTSQATFLKAFPAQYDGGISTSTYIGLMYDPDDFIVNARTAMEGWHSLLARNPFYRYDLPNTGHASPEIHPNTYRTALRILQDTLVPLPAQQRPRTRYF